ncbi:MAG: HAD family phosphatase [Clostridia bacterium]|nr:HAD family phosphatase [Clostridia bacterium]
MNVLLFDFDGTLVDSMPTYGRIMLEVVQEYNVPGDPMEILRKITPLGLKDAIRYFISLGANANEDVLYGRITRDALEEYKTTVPAKNNVIETLKILHEKGYCLNVLTASPHATLDPCLKRLGIYDWFENVWSCEDFKTTKANPEIYVMAAEKIGVDVSDVWFLDDNIHAVSAAKQAGAKTFGVYDITSAEKKDEMKAITDGYVTDFSELIELLEV